MIYDLIIVGAGSGGLSAAIYAGRAMLSTLIIEKSSVGGRIKDTFQIDNYPGFTEITGQELINKFREQSEKYSTNNFMYGTVTRIKKEKDSTFTVSTKRKGDFRAKAVIAALGTKTKTLNIEGEYQYDGKGVSYCSTCDAEFFKGKDIHILGSGNVALEEAEYLANYANKISIIVLHEEGIVDGSQIQYHKLLKNPKIEFIWNTEVLKIKGNNEFLKGLKIKNRKTGEIKKISSEGLFIFIGVIPQTEILKDIAELDKDGFVTVDEKCQTKIEGLYAVGDCTNTYLKQVVTAVSDGAKAAVAAEKYIRGK